MKILSGSIFYLLFPCLAFAQITLQEDTSMPVPSVLLAGSTFSVNLQLNNQTATAIAGYDVDVESLSYNLLGNNYSPVSNDFSLTGVTLTSPELNLANETSPTPSSPLVLAPQAGPSTQPFDLGASNLVTGETIGKGVVSLETLSFNVAANATPGVYELEFYSVVGNAQGPPTISDDDFDSVGTASTPFYSNSFTVLSAPEPPSGLLFGIAVLFLLPLVWNQLRRA